MLGSAILPPGRIRAAAATRRAADGTGERGDCVAPAGDVPLQKELDSLGTPQFGLVAEEVAKVDPDLVARDEEGKLFAVRSDAVNAMLLNEFLEEHRKVEEQASEIGALKSALAEMQSALAKQAAQIEKVSAAVAGAGNGRVAGANASAAGAR